MWFRERRDRSPQRWLAGWVLTSLVASVLLGFPALTTAAAGSPGRADSEHDDGASGGGHAPTRNRNDQADRSEKDAPHQALLQSVTGVNLASVSSGYLRGHAVPVSCLERDAETGEHISDQKGLLRYAPFPVCKETGQPLSLTYGVDQELTCTIELVSDPFFHMLEYYIHNDVPLTCRIPTIPLSPEQLARKQDIGPRPINDLSSHSGEDTVAAVSPDLGFGIDNPLYTPMVLSLSGVVQMSHIHLSNKMNMVLHTTAASNSRPASKDKASIQETFKPILKEGSIMSATAYSSSLKSGSKLVIGDPLPLHFSVHWYGSKLPAASGPLSAMFSAHEQSPVIVLFGRLCLVAVGAVFAFVWVSYRLSVGKPAMPGRFLSTGKFFARSRRPAGMSVLPMLNSRSNGLDSAIKSGYSFRSGGGSGGYTPSPHSGNGKRD